jgi:hypothetical protein
LPAALPLDAYFADRGEVTHLLLSENGRELLAKKLRHESGASAP